MPDSKHTKKISAKAIMLDLKDGLSDSELAEKYGLTFQGLQDLFSKLIAAKLATPTYFEKRALSQAAERAESEKTRVCPYCGTQNQKQAQRCSNCNQDISEWLDTVELTKILTGGFE
jgi:NADH pyrophosphatase NudC (nudix superfamily)